MDTRIFLIKKTTWVLIQRMAVRTFFLWLMTVVGWYVLDALIQHGRADQRSFVASFPEVLSMLKAAATFTFVEMSLFWIQLATQPKNDSLGCSEGNVHSETANATPISAAIVHAIDTLKWLARFVIFIYLMGPV